ncbi:putative leader peptide [Planotetraspora phitsanulokensis]
MSLTFLFARLHVDLCRLAGGLCRSARSSQ